MKSIPLCEADLNEDDVQAVASTLRDGWISSAAPVVDAFEEAFLAQLHAWGASPVLGCVATQSGTSALWMCLHLLDLPQGSEVLCPATSFVASIHPFLYQKHRLRLVDVHPLTFAPTLEAYQSAKTSETKVVLVTHLYGLAMPELLKLRHWCDAEGLILIEDAAESLGTLVDDKPVGTIGHYGFYSFNVNKTLTTASGGVLVSEDHTLLAKLKHQSTQAKCYGSGELFHDALGFNLRMNALHASLGISQLKRLPAFLDAKARIADGYFQAFKGKASLDLVHHHNPPYQNAFEHITPSYWLNLLYLDNHDKRKALQGALQTRGVQVRPVFMPFTAFDYVHPFLVEASLQEPRVQFENAYALWERGLNLPSSPHLSKSDQARVIELVLEGTQL
jgi:perosamine synthetase